MRNLIRAVAVICLGVGMGSYVGGNSLLTPDEYRIGPDGGPGVRGQFGFRIDRDDMYTAAICRGVGAGLITAGIVALLLTTDWTAFRFAQPSSEQSPTGTKTSPD